MYKTLFSKVVDDKEGEEKPKIAIQYHIDILLTGKDDPGRYLEFIEILATTQNMSYLSSEFVQRILNYHWSMVRQYYFMLFCSFFCSAIMIIVNVALI